MALFINGAKKLEEGMCQKTPIGLAPNIVQGHGS